MSAPTTIARVREPACRHAKTLVWNGPLGAFETQPFDRGTVAAAKAGGRARPRRASCLSVAGGGDTVAALAHAGVEDDFTYVSTAGGAFLEWLEGKNLPGVEALTARLKRRGWTMNLDELNAIANEDGGARARAFWPPTNPPARSRSASTRSAWQNTEDNRRDYRELLFRTDAAMKDHISGVILYDETIRQKAKDGTPLVKLIEAAGAVPGIKVDAGAKPLAGRPGETITEGLDGLRERLPGISQARRALRQMARGDRHRPEHPHLQLHQRQCAGAGALCRAGQENGIVPIVEPEVLMDGDHDIDALRRRHRMGAEGSVPGALLSPTSRWKAWC